MIVLTLPLPSTSIHVTRYGDVCSGSECVNTSTARYIYTCNYILRHIVPAANLLTCQLPGTSIHVTIYIWSGIVAAVNVFLERT